MKYNVFLSLIFGFFLILSTFFYTQKVSAQWYTCGASSAYGCNAGLANYNGTCQNPLCVWEAGCSCTCGQRYYCDETNLTCKLTIDPNGFQNTPSDGYAGVQCGVASNSPPTCAQYLSTTYPGGLTGGVCYSGDAGGLASCQATCVPPVWVKLKNTSFASANALNESIPPVPVAYDGTDDGTRNFIIGNPGLVYAPSTNLNGGAVSTKGWKTNLTETISMTPADYLAYVKSRKTFITISSLSDISGNNNTILIWGDGSGALTIGDSDVADFNNKNLVVIVNGDLNINATSFAPSSAKIAFLVTGTITFAGDPSPTTIANGIFIAPTIDLGTTANHGIEIIGNLTALTTLTNNRHWLTAKPTAFVIFDQSYFITLLPFLSTSSYQWSQSQ